MKKIQHLIEYAAFRAVMSFFSLFSVKTTRAILGGLGALIGSLPIKPRKIALANLELALGDQYSSSQRQTIVRENFRHLAWMVADMLQWKKMHADPDRYFNLIGMELYEKTKAQHGAVIIMGFHYASFEWAGRYISSKMNGMNIVVKDQSNPYVDRWTKKIRTQVKVNNIPPKHSLGAIRDSLERGEDLIFIFDQHAKKHHAIYVPFFGRLAATGRRLAELSMDLKVPILGTSGWWEKDGSLHGGYHSLIEFQPTGDRERDVMEYSTILNQFIEDRIREHPIDWIWAHRRWRPIPEGA